MEENTELITCVGVSESESKSKYENMPSSNMEEKVDLKDIVLFPSESYINERLEEEHLHNLLSLEPEELFKQYANFRIMNEPFENEISNDISEKANEPPDQGHEKSPIEFSTNVLKEQKIKGLFCFLCSLQFDGKSVYDLHQSLVHGINDGSKSEDSEVKIEIDSEISETIKESSGEGNLNKDIESVHKEKKQLKCNDCGKAFSRKPHLNGRIASVHKGKKPFKCNDCDKAFSQKPNMNKPIELVHEGKKL